MKFKKKIEKKEERGSVEYNIKKLNEGFNVISKYNDIIKEEHVATEEELEEWKSKYTSPLITWRKII